MKHTQPSRPSHDVYVVEGDGETAFWTRIGAAWPHQNGDGYNIQLTCVPIDGRLIIRKRKPKDVEAGR